MSPLILLILITTLIRVVMGWALGLGIDETYMVAASRHLELSYYDHPPIAWWLTHAAMALSGSQASVIVRLPFILLFALSTWLMARITSRLFDSDRAGFWAAFILNLSPVYAVTGGGWVLPDGPLDCALLGFLLFSLQATGLVAGGRPWVDWLAAGACAGLAMLSKYNGVLVLAGLPVFLATTATGRLWLRRPQPWVAGLLAVILFTPVIFWNVEHHWASFAFQGDRAGGLRFRPLAPLGVWGGEALFVLPWIWVPLILLWLAALRRGPAEPRGWLLALLAAAPILLFALVSIWSSDHILYHWSAPGTLMLFPLLGVEIARRLERGAPRLRRGIVATAALLVFALVLTGTQMRLNWVTALAGPSFLARAKDVAGGVNWTGLRPQLEARGLLAAPGLVVAVTKWNDAGKVDYALGGSLPVVVLAADAREYGVFAPADRYIGHPMLILMSSSNGAADASRMASLFDRVTVLQPLVIYFGGFPLLKLSVLKGEGFHGLAMVKGVK
ncbi:glycosyltransferase family 39 protein [Acidisoma sp.]|uniref:glycosyltransferase family 39 protein n=1 Tax=Acidisoma sp. TaxID=1872115 RepID=UPI003AFFB5D5